jgi:hypothetical protein
MENKELPLLAGFGEIAKTSDTKFRVIPVPEWGRSVRLGSLSVSEILEWAKDTEQKNLDLLVLSLVDGDGIRIGNRAVDVPLLRTKSHEVVQRLIRAAEDINGLRQKPEEAVREAKNGSGETVSVGSHTVSPASSRSSMSTPSFSVGSA